MSVSLRLRACVLLSGLAACGGPPEPITQPELMPDPSPFVYPTALWDQKMRGETLLLMHVTAGGQVDSVTVSNSSGRAEFDSAAVTGARKLRFVPGRRGDRPVEMWTKLPVRFEVDSVKVGR
jgi:periplasmic protein TonB